MTKYITVKLTEDQFQHIKQLVMLEIIEWEDSAITNKGQVKKAIAYNRRLQTTLRKQDQLNYR